MLKKKIRVQDHTNRGVEIWVLSSFYALFLAFVIFSCVWLVSLAGGHLLENRSMSLHFRDSLPVLSTNLWNWVDSTWYPNGIILHQKEQCRAAVSPNAALSVETWGVDSPSKARRLKNNVVTELADNKRQRAVLLNTAQSNLSLPAQPSRLLKGLQKAAGEMTRAEEFAECVTLDSKSKPEWPSQDTQ